jgi:hypothetical protein
MHLIGVAVRRLARVKSRPVVQQVKTQMARRVPARRVSAFVGSATASKPWRVLRVISTLSGVAPAFVGF